jgi:hypothetical protein
VPPTPSENHPSGKTFHYESGLNDRSRRTLCRNPFPRITLTDSTTVPEMVVAIASLARYHLIEKLSQKG